MASNKKTSIFIVITETNEDGDTWTDILDGKFFLDRNSARKAMRDDFRKNKKSLEDCDIGFDKDKDDCVLSANCEWSKRWVVTKLTGDIPLAKKA